MELDVLSSPENIENLKQELAHHYKNREFLACDNMGQILRLSLDQVLKR